MSESIHGHEVLEMILASKTPFTSESLVKAIDERFGKNARFHTCSAENMTARELVVFLEERGKFVPQGAGFTTVREKMCSHGDHDHDHDHKH